MTESLFPQIPLMTRQPRRLLCCFGRYFDKNRCKLQEGVNPPQFRVLEIAIGGGFEDLDKDILCLCIFCLRMTASSKRGCLKEWFPATAKACMMSTFQLARSDPADTATTVSCLYVCCSGDGLRIYAYELLSSTGTGSSFLREVKKKIRV